MVSFSLCCWGLVPWTSHMPLNVDPLCGKSILDCLFIYIYIYTYTESFNFMLSDAVQHCSKNWPCSGKWNAALQRKMLMDLYIHIYIPYIYIYREREASSLRTVWLEALSSPIGLWSLAISDCYHLAKREYICAWIIHWHNSTLIFQSTVFQVANIHLSWFQYSVHPYLISVIHF